MGRSLKWNGGGRARVQAAGWGIRAAKAAVALAGACRTVAAVVAAVVVNFRVNGSIDSGGPRMHRGSSPRRHTVTLAFLTPLFLSILVTSACSRPDPPKLKLFKVETDSQRGTTCPVLWAEEDQTCTEISELPAVPVRIEVIPYSFPREYIDGISCPISTCIIREKGKFHIDDGSSSNRRHLSTSHIGMSSVGDTSWFVGYDEKTRLLNLYVPNATAQADVERLIAEINPQLKVAGDD